MRSVGRENTAIELVVRRYLHAAGLRYSLHGRQLPGRPDIVLPCRGSVVLVHGCFWHGHRCKHGLARARSNTSYWDAKIADNRQRDRRQCKQLRSLGWKVEVVWECMTRNERAMQRLAERLLAR
jgi:DNA mismatch endonuclease (patch repair protein)